MIGRLVSKRYQLLERIGDGGMATVYRGEDILLERRIAVKVLKPPLVADEEFLRRFRREARAAASLSHPNIVNVYDVGQEGDLHYIVMEHVEGRTLKDLIREHGRVAPGDAVFLAAQIARALEHAHASGLVHRDIKPHNILIANDGRVKVTDFGIARVTTGSTLTYGDNGIVGSVTYFSPEQARGDPTEAASDLYSLGVVLYEMLAGRPPFTGEGPFGIALKHIQEIPRPLAEACPGLPPELVAIVERVLEKDPAARYGTATEMRRALEAVARRLPRENRLEREDDFPTVIPPALRETGEPVEEERPRVAARRKGKRRRGYLVAGLAAVAVLVTAGYFGYRAFLNWWVVPEVIVPNVVGVSMVQAERRLAEFRLSGRVVGEQFHEEAPPGQVLRQRPEAGVLVREGRVIELWISRGRELVEEVPNVVGLPIREARLALFQEGLTVGGELPVYSDEIPAEFVVAQSPAPGTRGLIKGSPIYLDVSLGPEPVTFALPSFEGEALEAVKQRLREMELVEGAVTEEEGPGTPGTVMGQSPAPGTVVQTGTVIDLVVVKALARPTKQVVVSVDVPAEGPSKQDVRVVVVDRDGTRTRTAYQQDGVAAGTRLRTLIDYEGDSATIRILIDGRVVREYVVY
ncbi:MAG: Stk1 family PASTA domain-containing Ser/Thr kinase [bacterium]|nr:Stk1 family PASTA domain-containing Ser/Thr kinase [bacterium]